MPNYVLMEVDTFRTLIREELSAITIAIDPNQQKSSLNEPLKTRKEMAKDLDISLVTLGEWMKKGLPYRRLNGRIYFLFSEVMEYMKHFTDKSSRR